ncbi:hypothetical protein RB595_008138 [Gaeumannomyces hyphopodioides]
MSPVRTFVVSLLLTLAQAPGLAFSQNQPVAVTGVTSGVNTATGQRPARLDINTLQNSGPQWDLYILGLLRFQSQAEGDELSYFQIAGIHGRPYIAWNGVEAVAGGVNKGYCPHNDIQFAAWHRPYLALYEQVLSGHVSDVASMYTGSNAAAYQAAAATWRAPYWDWAADPALPQVASTPNITVNGPDGQVTVPNPLWSYKWQQYPLNSNWFPTSQDRNLWGWPQTTRQPDGRGNSRINIVNSNLADVAKSLKDSVYSVLTRVTSYNTMATTASRGASFENPHNDVHTTMYAVMAYLDYSAFDPIFMLHHCNVDRYIAMWQAINYNNTFQTVAMATNGQFSTVRGSSVNGDSPLRPFYRDTNGNFHTGRSVANIAPFGYTYPEIDDWSQGKEGTRAAVIAAVNSLYGGGLAGSQPTASSSSSSSARPSSTARSATSSARASSSAPATSGAAAAGSATQGSSAPTLAPGGGGNSGVTSPIPSPIPLPIGQGPGGPPTLPGPPLGLGLGGKGKGGKGKRRGLFGRAAGYTEGASSDYQDNKSIYGGDDSAGDPTYGASAAASERAGTSASTPASTLTSSVEAAPGQPTHGGNAPSDKPTCGGYKPSAGDGPGCGASPADTKASYSVQAEVERGELDLPCTIYFYVGSRRAGRMSIPSMPTTGMTYSTFALDRFLQLSDEDAGPSANGTGYEAGNSTMVNKLQGQLRAEIKQINGSYTPVASAPSLKLQVQEREIAPPPTASQLPQIVGEAYKSEPVNPGDAKLGGLYTK